MLIYAGIDEAGYGPMLGPLCVAATAFVISEHESSTGDICDLWKRLKKGVCRKRTDKRNRIAIDDSKKLKLPNDSESSHPLRFLERGVLSFLGTGCDSATDERQRCPDCDDRLFETMAVSRSQAPWYSSITSLPVAQSLDELRIATSRLKRTLHDEGIACPLMRCEAIDAESFNHQVELMGVKSNVNFCAVMRHIDAIWKRWPHEAPHVVVDRQGGRTHYLRDLMTAYPNAQVQILEESELLSQYRIEQNESRIKISFTVEAESAHLPVALASMIAKYVRELFMMRLNRFFQGMMPELKPTAGYTEDARRYLTDIESLISQRGIDRKSLIRSV